MAESTTFHLYEKQIKFLEDKKWNFRLSRSELMRKILDYFIEHPNELKKIIEESNNEK